jgi:hypothetical protein
MGLRWDDPKDRRLDTAVSWLLAGAALVIVTPLVIVWVAR